VNVQPIDQLRQLLVIAERGELGELGDWLAPRLKHYLTGASVGVSLEQVLDLAVSPGRAPWRREEAQRARDDAIRELADRHFGNLDLNGQANALLETIRRYRGSRWRFDRLKDHMPESYAGTRSELLYETLRRGGGDLPGSKKHLLRILTARVPS